MSDMLAVLPSTETHGIAHVETAMPELREIANNCPACIMAALRQKGFYITSIESFDFTKECKDWWDEFNYDRYQYDDGYGY